MTLRPVTLAKAGVPLFSKDARRGIPAFAGMTIVWLFALLFFSTAAPAQTFPELTGRVVDQADLLRPEQELDLTSKLAALEEQTGRQLVIATVASLEDRTIEDYGYRLGREWGIGQEGEDDGVVLLVAPNERKVRIETGYGARVFLTDAMSSIIIRESILPRFRDGDFAGGIAAGADQIIGLMRLPPEEAARRAAEVEASEAARSEERPGFLPVIFMMVIFFTIIGALSRGVRGSRYRSQGKGRRRRGFDSGDVAVILWGLSALSGARGGGGGWGGGGGGFGGGGFGGFSGGGGSFGGGGASGGW